MSNRNHFQVSIDTNSSNEHRDKALETHIGTYSLRIPGLRKTSFPPYVILERYQQVR